jgi:D-threo-aldose 1-dehydrogenase
VVSVIPGGQTVDQVRGNRSILDAKIPPTLWDELKAEGLIHADAPIAAREPAA